MERLLTLDQGVVGKIYQVTGFKNNLKQETHLKNLGLSVGSSLHFIEKQKTVDKSNKIED